MSKSPHQPWIRSARFDGLFILAPPFVALLVVALLPARYRTTAELPVSAWVILVLFIDVAHVYSTLFRTYFDKERRRRQSTLYAVVPLACYAAGVALYAAGALVFWRLLAYLAVFHFVRQQYGFLRLYARHEKKYWGAWLDTLVIYAATLYPLVWWHFSPGRHFNWFVDHDFLQIDWPLGRRIAGGSYALLLLAYALKEARQWSQTHLFNWPRNLLIIGTAASWYVGIVVFNGDLTFTLLNVVAHGVPYLALVWVTSPIGQQAAISPAAGLRAIGIYLGLVVGLAWLEEGLWDGLVWREHGSVFGFFHLLPYLPGPTILMWLVPLLALPQATHYVLDGFIWRRRDDTPAKRRPTAPMAAEVEG